MGVKLTFKTGNTKFLRTGICFQAKKALNSVCRDYCIIEQPGPGISYSVICLFPTLSRLRGLRLHV